MRLRLTLADHLSEKFLEALHVVMLEHPDVGPAHTYTNTNGGMVELVRNDQATLTDQGRDDSRIRRKTHRAKKSVLHTHEPSNQGLCLDVQIERTTLQTAATRRDTVPLDGFDISIRACSFGLSKPKVVVGGNVEGPSTSTSEVHVLVVIRGVAVENLDSTAWDASYRGGEAVVNAQLEPTGIERVEVRV